MKKIKKLLICMLMIVPCILLLSACGDDKSKSNLKNFEGLALTSISVDYDGTEKEIVITGTLPEGATVAYTNNKATNAGTYNATAVVKCDGYNDLTLNATLTINKLNYDLTNTKWDYESAFTYDGTEKKVELLNLPDGVTVANYTNNKAINAGTYTASATLNYDTTNHRAPNIPNQTWEIKKATITGITFENKTFTYDETEKEIAITGTLPKGVSVTYTNNKQTKAGTYIVSATISGANYETRTLSAKLVILPNLSQLANVVVSSLLNVPNPWEFLPESFALENKVYNGGTIDFSTDFVDVSSIPQIGMGKQMNVVYSTLLEVEDALGYLGIIYGSMNTIVDLYQTFINSNPDNYATYETSSGDFTFKILLDENNYKMYVNYKSVAIELMYTQENKKCEGRIQLSNSNVIKYEMAENSLTIAVSVFNVAMTKLHFKRNSQNLVEGYLYEFYGTETKNIKTTALIKVDKDYTSIVSNKRETDDLIIEGYMEVYDNKTANLVGAQVKETVKSIDYDTKWYNLYNVTGINNIKVTPEQNTMNADTIYINNNTDPIKTKLVGGLTLRTASRRFDIEMKDMYFYTYNSETEKYEKVKINIPMLFVQSDFVGSFTEDFNEKNGVGASIDISINQQAYFYNEYDTCIDKYLELKEKLTYAEIVSYIGEKDQYFN